MKASLTISKDQTNHLPRIGTFDLLRGLAILVVICVHTAQHFSTGYKRIDEFLELGRFGVQLFYFTSALTMCYVWKLCESETGRWWKFYVRRFLRIAPLYWLATLVCLLVYGVGASYWTPDGIGIRHVVLNALFWHGFWPDTINSVVPGGWTIAVEMTFYVVFPLLIFKIKKPVLFLVLAITIYFLNNLWLGPLVAGFLGRNFHAGNPALIKDFLYLNFMNQCPVFLLGIYLYLSANDENRLKTVGYYFLGWIIVALAAWRGCLLRTPDFLFLSVMLGGFVLTWAILAWRPHVVILEKMGRNSYAIYLCHILVLDSLGKAFDWFRLTRQGILPFLTGLFLASVISFGISVVTYHLIEKRVQRLADRMTGRGCRKRV
jgi:exopolysaccharide production protein ExoZ